MELADAANIVDSSALSFVCRLQIKDKTRILTLEGILSFHPDAQCGGLSTLLHGVTQE